MLVSTCMRPTALQPAHLMPLLGATGCKIYRTEQNRMQVMQDTGKRDSRNLVARWTKGSKSGWFQTRSQFVELILGGATVVSRGSSFHTLTLRNLYYRRNLLDLSVYLPTCLCDAAAGQTPTPPYTNSLNPFLRPRRRRTLANFATLAYSQETLCLSSLPTSPRAAESTN
jgi:hypothetical protein